MACHHIHTHMWPWETTCPFCSLSMSRNDSAHSLEHATTTEDTQELPRAFQVPHKPCLPLCSLAKPLPFTCHPHELQSPQQAGRHHCIAAKLHCRCLCTRCTNRCSSACAHGTHLRASELLSTVGFCSKGGETPPKPRTTHNKPGVLAKPALPSVFIILNTRTDVSVLC